MTETKALQQTFKFARYDVMRNITREWEVETVIDKFGKRYCSNCLAEKGDKSEKEMLLKVVFLNANVDIYDVTKEQQEEFDKLLVKHNIRMAWEKTKLGDEPAELTDKEKYYLNIFENEKIGRKKVSDMVMKTPQLYCYDCALKYRDELISSRSFIVGFEQKQLSEFEERILQLV